MMMIYYKELTHIIMEAEKSHDLPPASWRPRETNGINPSETSGLRTWGSVVEPRSEARQEEVRCPNSLSEAERGKSLLPLPFVLFKPSTVWTMPTHTGEGCLLYWVPGFKG